MAVSLLQANVGRARGAQDLLLQTLAECGCTLGIAAEPNHIPQGHPCWTGDEMGSVAITWRWWKGAPTCSPLESGRHFVAVRWGSVAVVGVYLPPSGTLAEFEMWLEDLGACIGRLQPMPIIVAGDFNAWSRTWGSRTTRARGRTLEEWAAALDLVLLNRGNVATCVRTQGESVIDLTWASPLAARMVRRWKVMVDKEHLSIMVHRYIMVHLEAPAVTRSMDHHRGVRRWTLRKLDEDRLIASLTSSLWSRDENHEEEESNPIQGVNWVIDAMTRACDASMPRTRVKPRRSTYWWTEEIADLRRVAIQRSRGVARSRGNRVRRNEALANYREARKVLRMVIKKAKVSAWEELFQTLEEDPWGRPYRIVLNRLRPAAPPLTETLEPRFVREVVTALFPAAADREPDTRSQDPEQEQAEDLEMGEFLKAVQRGFKGNTAPGPDGLHKKVWAVAMRVLAEPVRRLLDACLKGGVFPPEWRRAKLVLLRKEGKDAGSPSAYRPICLLDEIGKLYERVIANRLVQHLTRVGPGISEAQYGFREGLSTIDTIQRVRGMAEKATSRGGVALAVSLDISNAFNSLPWDRILDSFRWHGIPGYLVNVVGDYLRDRWVSYTDQTGSACRERLHRGVPQGSVLGQLLWDIGYNAVLQTALPPSCGVVCYADDTLVVAEGRNWDEVLARGEVAVHSVVRSIREAGLKVATSKTEALAFYEKAQGPPPQQVSTLAIGASNIALSHQIKYLGLILDSGWTFSIHFADRARRIQERANALRGLLPNLGGASGRVRRLYANTVRSIALYGAPVWEGDLAASRKNKAILNRAFHVVAIRAARAYRTVSQISAAVLANLPPLELVAREYACMYRDVRAIRARGVQVTVSLKARLRERYRQETLAVWGEILAAPSAQGQRVAEAIQPVLEEWSGRAWGPPHLPYDPNFYGSRVLWSISP